MRSLPTLALAAIVFCGSAAAATITVNTTADTIANDGVCTLREAILSANTNAASGALAGECTAGAAGIDTIAFAIPGSGVQTISVATNLPAIVEPIAIDGLTQPLSYRYPNLLVALSGSGATTGLMLDAGSNGSTIRGLVIGNFTTCGIDVRSSSNTIASNFIGIAANGTTRMANGSGILLAGNNNTIGGPARANGNLISGNTRYGVDISTGADASTSGIVLLQNFIGTNATGDGAVGNGTGVRVGPLVTALIGDADLGGLIGKFGNLISGNSGDGVVITSAGRAVSTPVTVRGNVIGLGDGTLRRLPNGGNGIFLDGTRDVGIGVMPTTGPTGAFNQISGNTRNGIYLLGATHTTIQRNSIGEGMIEADGNGLAGVRIENSSDNLIGASASGGVGGNSADFNGAGGFVVISGVRNRISMNLAAYTGGRAIDLGGDGKTANDLCDGDTGPNELVNVPQLTAAAVFTSSVTLSGRLNAAPGTGPYDIEVFHRAAGARAEDTGSFSLATTVSLAGCDGTFSVSVPLDSNGKRAFEMGDSLVALAIDHATGDTSELSDPYFVVAQSSVTLTASPASALLGDNIYFTATMNSSAASGTVTLKEGNSVIASKALSFGRAVIGVSVLSAGTHTIYAEYSGDASYQPSTSNNVQVFIAADVKSDLNHDGRSDIVLQNSADNSVAVWLMNSTTLVKGKVIAAPQPGWRVVATGDLDGDHKADLIVRNSETGAAAVWRMDGTTLVKGTTIGTPGVPWRVVGTFDFTGDGMDDVVLQNETTGAVQMWDGNGAILTDLGNPGPDVRAIAAGHVGGGAIVFQNRNTRAISRWLIVNRAVASDVTISTPAADWTLVALGDFDGDGRGDLALQNDATNAIAIWLLENSGSAIVTGGIAGTPVAAWKLMGCADYDGNGRSDLLLFNAETNVVAQWQMNGTHIAKTSTTATNGTWKPLGN